MNQEKKGDEINIKKKQKKPLVVLRVLQKLMSLKKASISRIIWIVWKKKELV